MARGGRFAGPQEIAAQSVRIYATADRRAEGKTDRLCFRRKAFSTSARRYQRAISAMDKSPLHDQSASPTCAVSPAFALVEFGVTGVGRNNGHSQPGHDRLLDRLIGSHFDHIELAPATDPLQKILQQGRGFPTPVRAPGTAHASRSSTRISGSPTRGCSGAAIRTLG